LILIPENIEIKEVLRKYIEVKIEKMRKK
jgi:hypothetical protein